MSIVHIVKEDGKYVSASKTICGLVGMAAIQRPDYYKTAEGFFQAVLPSDMKRGGNCPKCRGIAAKLRGRGKR